MSISSWGTMLEDLVSDRELKELTDEQVCAMIDVLALTIHADQKVTSVEVAGFNHLFFDLPWLEDRHEMIRTHIPKSAEKASVAGDESRGRDVAKEAAEILGEMSVREKVFQVAAGLAAVDTKYHPGETAILDWIADEFGLSEEKRKEILSKANP